MTKFGKWLNTYKHTRPEAAAELGITRQYVCMLSSGSASPGMSTAYAIQHWTKRETPDDPVMVADWPVHAAAGEATPLGAFLTRQSITREECAKALGWTSQKVYNLAAGTTLPTHEEAVEISKWSRTRGARKGVGVGAWRSFKKAS
jgi:DNA-binding XRE family transcriptional regulator